MKVDGIIDFQGTDGFRSYLKKQGYSDQAIFYCIEKPNLGILKDADIITETTGSCDDTMRLHLKLDRGHICDARVDIFGCAGTISAAMALVDLVRGKTIAQATDLQPDDFFSLLGPFPEEKHKCIHKALKILKKAIYEYRS